MVDINRYLVKETVKRNLIVADIKRGNLSKNDIEKLNNNVLVKKSYFGDVFLDKRDKDEWTNKYLDELSLVAVSEKFNYEYLLYLCEVAEFIRKDNEKKEHNKKIIKIVVGGVICIIITGLIIALFISKGKKDSVTLSINSIPLTKMVY